MSTLRFHSLKASMDRDPIIVNDDFTRSSIFGTNVFSLAVMQTYLSKSTYERLIFSVEKNQAIDSQPRPLFFHGVAELRYYH